MGVFFCFRLETSCFRFKFHITFSMCFSKGKFRYLHPFFAILFVFYSFFS